MSDARILDAGETALTVEFGEDIDPVIHDKVMALDKAVSHSKINGLIETVPTIRSLIIHYDPLTISRDELVTAVSTLPVEQAAATKKEWTVPVCASMPYGEDLDAFLLEAGLDHASFEDALCTRPVRAYMYGFAPGYLYLGDLDQRLFVKRRLTPRPPIPPSSLILAAGMAVIASVSMPTGWYVVAKTPLAMFDHNRQPMVPFETGDLIHFQLTSEEEFEALCDDLIHGKAELLSKSINLA